jgi:hypothetical protein
MITTELFPKDWYWIVGGDRSRWWSSAAGAYVEILPEDAGVTSILDEEELTNVLALYGLPGPVARRRKIPKSVVQDRLIAAGKMEAAKEALDGNAAYFARWFAPDHPEVYADDPDALLLLAAIGADSAIIMAPEV